MLVNYKKNPIAQERVDKVRQLMTELQAEVEAIAAATDFEVFNMLAPMGRDGRYEQVLLMQKILTASPRLVDEDIFALDDFHQVVKETEFTTNLIRDLSELLNAFMKIQAVKGKQAYAMTLFLAERLGQKASDSRPTYLQQLREYQEYANEIAEKKRATSLQKQQLKQRDATIEQLRKEIDLDNNPPNP